MLMYIYIYIYIYIYAALPPDVPTYLVFVPPGCVCVCVSVSVSTELHVHVRWPQPLNTFSCTFRLTHVSSSHYLFRKVSPTLRQAAFF